MRQTKFDSLKDSNKYLFRDKIIFLFDILAVKHRIPSPTREAGDGMEASKNSSPNSNNSLTNPSVSETPVKLIKLPKTNISVEKLPPITDDKVKLPVTEPSSPLGMIKLKKRVNSIF